MNKPRKCKFYKKKGKSTDIIGQTTHTYQSDTTFKYRFGPSGVLRHVRECPTDSPFFNVTDHKWLSNIKRAHVRVNGGKGDPWIEKKGDQGKEGEKL